MPPVWLLFLAVGSVAAGRGLPDTAPESALVLPQIHIPIRQPHIATILPFCQGGVAWRALSVHAICGGVVVLPEPDSSALGLIELFGSAESYRTALAADAVEVVELAAAEDPFTTPRERSSSSVRLPEPDAALLRAVLTADAAYDWKADSPTPSRDGYRVKFKLGPEIVSLDLFLSSGCARSSSSTRVPLSTRFDFCRATVVSIINRHFPGASDDDY